MEAMPEETTAVQMCSKCEQHPQAYPGSTNFWCLECNAQQKREYVAKLRKQNADQAFARGVSAMRRAVMEGFSKIGASQCTGYDAAGWIATMPAPRFDAEIEG